MNIALDPLVLVGVQVGLAHPQLSQRLAGIRVDTLGDLIELGVELLHHGEGLVVLLLVARVRSRHPGRIDPTGLDGDLELPRHAALPQGVTE